MAEGPVFSGFDETPIYTIKTAVQRTGIGPDTLRAWERRYGALRPNRTDAGYRLYSQRDIAMLQWLKSQLENGISISKAMEMLQAGARLDEDRRPAQSEPRPANDCHGPGQLSRELIEVLLEFDEAKAETILSRAFAVHSVDTVTEAIISPILTNLGHRWQQGQVTAIQEHFISSFMQRKLAALLSSFGQPATGPLVLAGSAPGEWHDLGILMISISLRLRGFRVVHLGPNVPANDLLQGIVRLRPQILALSAATNETALRLKQLVEEILSLPGTVPQILLGGRAFRTHPELARHFPGATVIASAAEIPTLIAPQPAPA